MKTEDEDIVLTPFFQAARADREVSDTLNAKVMADALREMRGVARPLAAARNGFRFGWPSFAGLAGSAALGLAIGMFSPAVSESLQGSAAYSLGDLMPVFDLTAGEVTE